MTCKKLVIIRFVQSKDNEPVRCLTPYSLRECGKDHGHLEHGHGCSKSLLVALMKLLLRFLVCLAKNVQKLLTARVKPSVRLGVAITQWNDH